MSLSSRWTRRGRGALSGANASSRPSTCSVVPVPPWVARLVINVHADQSGVRLATFLPFFWAAAFGLAFAGGCLVARPSHAAAIGLAALMLLYVVPIVVPPLRWLNVADLDDSHDYLAGKTLAGWASLWGPPQLGFAAGMVAVAAVAFAVARVAVRRGWRVESGRRTLYGLVAAALLLAFASAAFQLATDLPVLATASLPIGEAVWSIRLDGDAGTVFAGTDHGVQSDGKQLITYTSRPLTVRGDQLILGPPTPLTQDRVNMAGRWSAARAHGVGYFAEAAPGESLIDPHVVYLGMFDTQTGASLGRLDLWTEPATSPPLRLWQTGNRLIVYAARLDVIDISRPGKPRVVSDEPWPFGQMEGPIYQSDDRVTVRLSPLPGLSPAERLASALSRQYLFDGSLLCMNYWRGKYDAVHCFRLTRLAADEATFASIGHYQPTWLQQATGGFSFVAQVSHGLVYTTGRRRDGPLNSGISVFDPGRAGLMRPVGHFAAAGAEGVTALADGRAVVYGRNKLWLVGRPRGQ